MDLSFSDAPIMLVANPPPHSGGGGPREARWRGPNAGSPSASHALGTSPAMRGRIGRAGAQ